MPTPVIFRHGRYEEYKSLTTPDEGTLYFITDRGLIFKGQDPVTNKIEIELSTDSNGYEFLTITDNSGYPDASVYEVYNRSAINNILQTYMTAADAMHFKGILGTGQGQVSLPQTGYKAGDVYKVGEAGTYAGQYCEVGDMVIAIKDYVSSYSQHDYTIVQENIDGAVTVPQHDYVLDSSNVIVGNGGRTIRKVTPHPSKKGNWYLGMDTDYNPMWKEPQLSEFPGILPVSHGGTGQSSFPLEDADIDSSGFVLVGNGTNPISTRKISSTMTGYTDSSVLLTAKAINDAINEASQTGVVNWLNMFDTPTP